MALSLWNLALTSALPVVNVFLMCAVGVLLARQGILDPAGRQMLSRLVFYIYVPALTVYNLGGSVDLQNLGIWWILPVNMVISIAMGLGIGWISGRLLKVDVWFRKHFMCVIALGNVGNLPLVLVSTICAGDTPFHAALGGRCEQLGIAYIAFGMWIASTFQYCVAYNMLKKPAPLPEAEAKTAGDVLQQRVALKPMKDSGLEFHMEELGQMGHKGGIEMVGQESEGPPAVLESPAEDVEASSGRMQSSEEWQIQQEEASALLVAEEPGTSYGDSGECWSHNWREWGSKLAKIPHWLCQISWGNYLNCPTLSAFAGLAVGCIPTVKALLFGEAPPLAFLSQALSTMAGGMIPSMMLILGGSLANGPGSSRLPMRVILGSILIRLLVIPALGTAVTVGLQRMGVFHPPDRLFTFTLLLMHATPTAMNLQTVATLRQNGEAELSCLLCWQYLSCLISLPLWMCLFVYLVAP